MQLSNREKFLLYAELAKLVAAGFGIDKSTELLSTQGPNRRAAGFARDLRAGLAKGLSFADALANAKPEPSALEVSVLQATESAGVLAEGLAYLRDTFESQWKLWRAVQGRLLYPALLLHLAAFVPVIPPLVTGAPLHEALARALWTLGAVYLAGAALWAAGRILDRLARTHHAVDCVLRAVPLLGGARRLIGLQRFAGIFRVYLRCGATVSVALDGAGAATQSAVLGSLADQLARVAEGGSAIGGPLEAAGVVPLEFARSVANAERIGGLEPDLARWSDHFGGAAAARLEQIGVWLPKGFYLMVAGYVGWQVIRTYAGIYEGVLKELERAM